MSLSKGSHNACHWQSVCVTRPPPSVYGSTIKELINEEFGDGIMSGIDFSMDIQREPGPKGDRINDLFIYTG